MSEVTQADREAAAAWFEQAMRDGVIRRGSPRDYPLARAFARHRLAERERCARVASDYAEQADRTVSASPDGACKISVMGEAVAGRAISAAIRTPTNDTTMQETR